MLAIANIDLSLLDEDILEKHRTTLTTDKGNRIPAIDYRIPAIDYRIPAIDYRIPAIDLRKDEKLEFKRFIAFN